MMGGTLLLLGQAGCELHYMTLSSGSLGSSIFPATKTRKLRRAESREGARLLGAGWRPPLADDLEIFYDLKTLRRLAAVIREVNPGIVLTHSPVDYMEDHTNTCRLAVTAAFSRGMPNFATSPRRPPVTGDVTVYHAMPHMLRDPLGRRVIAELFVDVGGVLASKRVAAAAHRSQKEWLDVSQGMDSYLETVESLSRAVGRASRKFRYAEGWRRHLPAGFGPEDSDPLRRLLGRRCFRNKAYDRCVV
ncbi:MAG: PIG-L family deacetylase [Verrucomicrobia bacterium]|nr:PIG-L family deacetylase [Verrucomicrobiota bacterium]MBI3868388.1 PIG-L family deacetylase [Verrucomicrobiota bacterium]